MTVNKVCGSGLKAVMFGAKAIAAGEHDVVVAGGMESMSNVPYYLPKARDGYRLGNAQVIDSLIHDGLWDVYSNVHMGDCAELCAKEKEISRGDQDAFAVESYRRALRAAGRREVQGRDRPGRGRAEEGAAQDRRRGRGAGAGRRREAARR